MYYQLNVDDISADRREALGGGQLARDHPADYKPSAGLVDAVNVALVLDKPLLLTGEPGTGKSQLAFSVAWQLAARQQLSVASSHVERFEAKSTSVARDLFYSFDTLGRFHAEYSKSSTNNADYITYNALGRALLRAQPFQKVADVVAADFGHQGPLRSVVLIDEIDKAPRDFPNDLLNEIDQMFFRVQELKNVRVGGLDVIDQAYRPIVIITSNSEKNLPDPFLRRCIYFDIPFPKPEALRDILVARLAALADAGPNAPLVKDATAFFFELREANATNHKLSPAELIQWLAYTIHRGAKADRPLREAKAFASEGLSALIKGEDASRVRTLLEGFVARR
ncbi:MAG: MoxR family ATPase [Gammaproteobacteria bacterium]